MSYSVKEFGGCMFNPLVSEPMVTKYPRLLDIINPDWNTEHLDLLIRFMICVYDPKSPMVINERDLNQRKGLAAEIVGLNTSDEELITSIYSFTYDFGEKSAPLGEGFVDLVIRFLMRFIKSKEYAAIVIVENCFWESAKKLMEPITGKNSKEELEAVQKKSAIKDELDKDIFRLDKYHKAFFSDDTELEVKAKSKMTPEAMAKKLSNV